MLLVRRIALGLAACLILSGAENRKPQLAWMQTALDRWDAACRNYLNIAPPPLPWIIFFDDRYAWHLNPDPSLLAKHKPLRASVKFNGRTYRLTQVEHPGGRLWVPDRDPLPLKPGGAAMPYGDGDRKVFYELAAPSLWQKESGSPPSRDLNEMVLGFAMHELTHTLQLGDVAPRIEAMRSHPTFPESVNDNLIENTFGNHLEFKSMWNQEWDQIQKGVLAENLQVTRQAVAELLAISDRRKSRFFVGQHQDWSELEDIFLVMEGLGMWVHYRMARDHAPPGEDWLRTLAMLTSRTDSWSQIEGLGLLLLIDRLSPGWQARFLAPGFPSPFAVLRDAINP